MNGVTDQIEEALKVLESEIAELRQLMTRWNQLAVNVDGSRKYKGLTKRIVLQSQRVDELIKANVYK